MRPRPEEVIDLDRYPVHDATSPLHREFLGHCRAELSADGCCRVRFSFAPKQSRPWRRSRFASRTRSTAAPPWPIPMAATSTRAFPKTIPAGGGARRFRSTDEARTRNDRGRAAPQRQRGGETTFELRAESRSRKHKTMRVERETDDVEIIGVVIGRVLAGAG